MEEPIPDRAKLEADLAELERLRDALSPSAQPGIQQSIRDIHEQLQQLTSGDAAGMGGRVDMQGGTVMGSNVGLNTGTINFFYGERPPADASSLLTNYLESVVATHSTLRMGRLLEQELDSHEQAAPILRLQKVYTTIATTQRIHDRKFMQPVREVAEALDAGKPADVLPDQVRLAQLLASDRETADDDRLRCTLPGDNLDKQWEAARMQVEEASGRPQFPGDESPIKGDWFRPELISEALANERRVILLGAPGSGKTTALRYLAVILAETLKKDTKQTLAQHGWDTVDPLPVPIFCPLSKVAKKLRDDPDQDMATLLAVLLNIVHGSGIREDLHSSILTAWRSGGVILLLDGLDEVSAMATGNVASKRERVAEAIRQLAHEVGRSRIVVTCRTRAYEQERAWQLREGWAERRLEPFALGQVRQFAADWYIEADRPPNTRFDDVERSQRVRDLILALDQSSKLREITASPLLLTMLLLLHFNRARLPDERADVYEALVSLLLDRWNSLRSDDPLRRPETIGQRLGLAGLTTDQLRPVIHRIAFEAHRQAEDGPGVVPKSLLYDVLDTFFAKQIDPLHWKTLERSRYADKSQQFVEILCEETGLLQAEDDDTFVMPHATFQEYLAACHLASEHKVQPIYDQWLSGKDRWHEPLLLLMRRLVMRDRGELAYLWLTRLVPQAHERSSPLSEQRQRDVILAADCYDAVGRAHFVAHLGYDAAVFQEELSAALMLLLESPARQPSTVVQRSITLAVERVRVGIYLAELGDPRPHVSSLPPSMIHIPGGSFVIGMTQAELAALPESEPDSEPAAHYRAETLNEDSITVAAFDIARFPVTNAQYAHFIANQGYDPHQPWWNTDGQAWLLGKDKGVANPSRRQPRNPIVQPLEWENERFGKRMSNHPVVGVSWYEAVAFCNWLTQSHEHNPKGYRYLLPTEAEWEWAARGSQRRSFPWGKEEPDEERANYGHKYNCSTAVGCFPLGTTPQKVHDLGGNVWEWTRGVHHKYPYDSQYEQEPPSPSDKWFVLRGGCWDNKPIYLRAANRLPRPPYFQHPSSGFRVAREKRLM